jgi:hypothetical protein
VSYPWQVCVEDGRAVRGAGILLDGEHVLTCAHVVASGSGVPEETSLRVRFDGQGSMPYRSAEIVPGCFCPADDETGLGDVALLRLRAPLRSQPQTLLRRNWRVGQRVRVFGYPDGVPHGLWADATVAGPAASRSQLVQLNVNPDGPRIEPGFSGAAVTDSDTGDLIGMITSCEQEPRGACWMIPVDAIVKNMPRAADYVSGPSTDAGFSDLSAEVALDGAERGLLRELAWWLGSDGPGGLCVIAGGRDSTREALLSRLTQRDEPGPGAVTGARAIDVAVRAAGKTASEISRQVVTGLGGGTTSGTSIARLVTDLGSPVGVVIDEMDAATEPDVLLDELIGLITRYPRPPIRLLLGFSSRVPDHVRNALIAELPAERRRAELAAPASLLSKADGDLAEVSARLDELFAAEERASRKNARVVIRITDVPPPDVAASAALRIRLAVLRATREGAGMRWLAELEACERAIQDRSAQVTTAMEELDRLIARRDDLRSQLVLFEALAACQGLEEDHQVSRYHQSAQEMVTRAPCNLGLTEQAVDSYYKVIMRCQGER